MSKNQPYFQYQEIDERVIVEEMIRSQDKHWEECYQYVKQCVNSKAKNMPTHLLDDMVQEILIKIMKYLPHFRFQCALKTWVNQIIEHHIIDEYRKARNDGPHLPFSVNRQGEGDAESLELKGKKVGSTEDTFEMLEQIRIGIAALLEYASTTANPIRNRHIIWLVLFEGKTYEEAAKAAGCNAPVVGYVVREAQRYAREKWGE